MKNKAEKIQNGKGKDNLKLILGIVMAFIFLIAFTCGYYISFFTKDSNQKALEELLQLINNHAYDYNEPDGEITIDDNAIFAILKENYLDEYAKYYTPEEYTKEQNASNGQNEGIGLSFSLGDYTVVAKVIGNSSADRAGIKAGDKIVAIEEDGNKKMLNTSSEIQSAFVGLEVDKEVILYVKRGDVEKGFTVKKSAFKATYVEYVDSEREMKFYYDGSTLKENIIEENKNTSLDDKTAIIKFTQFEGKAYEQFGKAIDFMFSNGRTRLILDVRNNGGGDLAILTKIASYLIYNGGRRETVVLIGEKRDGTTSYTTSLNNYNTKLEKTIVLANDGSASATESLIGAMMYYGHEARDNNFSYKTLIIEKNQYGNAVTYGKGIMQSTYELKTGGALKITSGKIFWPDSTCIHKKGIVQNQVKENAVEKATSTIDYAVNRAIEIIAQDFAN